MIPTSIVPNPWNFFAGDAQKAITDSQGNPTFDEQKFRTNLRIILRNMAVVSPDQFGARADGTSDNAQAINLAIQQATQLGGGTIQFTDGTYGVKSPIYIPANAPPIRFAGWGNATIIKRLADMPAGQGMIDVSGSNFSMADLVVDGNVTTPRGLQYGVDFNGIGGNDPMAPSLTQNSNVWVHGPGGNFNFTNLVLMHTGGYSILFDATTGDIDGILVLASWIVQNRPTLFGTNPNDLNYGSWNGGIFLKADCRTLTSGAIANATIALCSFERNNANCAWSHPYGFVRFCSNFRFIGNSFLDNGLDGILFQGVTGGVVANNVFRRNGYVTYNDTDSSVPKWLANLQATALDSGYVKEVSYACNSFLDINGGAIDTDGMAFSTISGNSIRTAYPTEPEWDEDRLAISGATNSGPTAYAVNMSNTPNWEFGCARNSILGNTIINQSAGSVRMFAGRDNLVEGNNIIIPDAPVATPIPVGPIGTGPYQRANNNRISHNRFQWSPASPDYIVKEDASIAAWDSSEKTYCFGNCPVIGNGNGHEFLPDAGSGSTTFAETIWFP